MTRAASLRPLLLLLSFALGACGSQAKSVTSQETAGAGPPEARLSGPGKPGGDGGGEPTSAPTPIADRYREQADRILEAALEDDRAWEKLAYLTDRIGHRLSGSEALERAIAWAAETMENEGHENVHLEEVEVPHWVRGEESATLLSPVRRPLSIIGLGNSVGTPKKGVAGEVLVVESWGELEEAADEVQGKIVLFNAAMPPYTEEHGSGYGELVSYRTDGPSRAAKLGARAALVRSLTARSLRTPHTGTLRYDDQAKKIPAAAVTIEDAELLARLAESGETVRVRLRMGAHFLPDAESANVIAELRGAEKPEEIVLLGAHIDSWDVGQGAHDDATGCAIMMQALTLLRELELRPRRTIRVVLYTNEENGLRGARAYAAEHEEEIPRHVMAIESDGGGFAPRGVRVKGNDVALEQARDVVSLLEPIGAAEAKEGFAGADLIPLVEAGVPGLGHWVDGSRYFDYHHTAADTLDKVDPDELARNVGAVAVIAYVIADMEERFGGRAEPVEANAEDS